MGIIVCVHEYPGVSVMIYSSWFAILVANRYFPSGVTDRELMEENEEQLDVEIACPVEEGIPPVRA